VLEQCLKGKAETFIEHSPPNHGIKVSIEKG
jgi:hypothetical protein